MKDLAALVLVGVVLIGSTFALIGYAELRGCQWPLDAALAVRAAVAGAAQAQDGAP